MMRKMIMIMSWWRTSWWSVEQIHVKFSPSLKMDCWTPPKMLLVEHKFPNGSGRDRQNLSRCFLQRGPTKKLSIPLPMSAFVIAGRFVLIFSTSHPFQCHHVTMPPVPSFCGEGLPLLGMVNFISPPVVVDTGCPFFEMPFVDPAISQQFVLETQRNDSLLVLISCWRLCLKIVQCLFEYHV